MMMMDFLMIEVQEFFVSDFFILFIRATLYLPNLYAVKILVDDIPNLIFIINREDTFNIINIVAH